MKKTEWIEEHEKEMEGYDKSILSHDDEELLRSHEPNSLFHHWLEDEKEVSGASYKQ
jgi:hypothetical protein